MTRVRPHPLPEHALLSAYTGDGVYTDCYVTDVPGTVSHEEYVEAFYTTPLFRLERLILRWAVARPSTDEQARRLAAGALDAFAAWRVEKRAENQLLLCDFMGRTRSWLMVAPVMTDAGPGTRLYFGSAVVPKAPSSLNPLFGFHKLYSRALLYSARTQLQKGARPG